MRYLAKSLEYVADSRDKSFASLVKIVDREGDTVRFFLYHFFPRVLPIRNFEASRLVIFLPFQEKEALNTSPFGAGMLRTSARIFRLNRRLDWIHDVASRRVVKPDWIEINSPLNFHCKAGNEWRAHEAV